jgi:glycosyltransferase involved in cell wall biosynthesis
MAKRKPLIIRSRHKFTPISNNVRHRVLYKYLPHGIITASETLRQEFMVQFGVEPSKIATIPTGVDLDMFQPGHSDGWIKTEFGFDAQCLVVGTVAFLRQEKGLQYLIQAAKRVLEEVPQAWFLIVGDGPEKEPLKRKIQELGLSKRVIMAGFRQDIPRILGALDVFVLPSLGEGTPQGVTQAFAMERPVVATAVGGVPEVVQDGINGFLVSPRDTTEMANCICKLLKDPALRDMFGKAGRKHVVEKYSSDGMLDKTEHFYKSLSASSVSPCFVS